ncbi:MAG: hypothetical protein CMJ83_09125 [Planctomycetes bacterium]|nr:hypothetical protein [Planctomycetota bacterium]
MAPLNFVFLLVLASSVMSSGVLLLKWDLLVTELTESGLLRVLDHYLKFAIVITPLALAWLWIEGWRFCGELLVFWFVGPAVWALLTGMSLIPLFLSGYLFGYPDPADALSWTWLEWVGVYCWLLPAICLILVIKDLIVMAINWFENKVIG